MPAIIRYINKHLLFLAAMCSAWTVSASPRLIAHAGGSIDGVTYTNSLEAVEHALANGWQYIELDLAFTCDGMLVASHEWYGCETLEREAFTPTYEQFMSHRVYDRFTPLDYYRIDSLMTVHPDFILVTDKISNYEVINTYFSKYKHRLLIECFSDSDYLQLRSDGYAVLRSGLPPTKKQMNKRSFRGNPEIQSFVFEATRRTCKKLPSYGGEVFALYTLPDIKTLNELLNRDPRIQYVYINNVEK